MGAVSDSQAVKASPEASLAWAAICLVLPVFTNPATQESENAEAFTYVTARMKYWIALESLVLPDTCTKSKEKLPIEGEGIRADMRTRIIDLYTKILNLQIRSVLRTYSSTGRVLLRDV